MGDNADSEKPPLGMRAAIIRGALLGLMLLVSGLIRKAYKMNHWGSEQVVRGAALALTAMSIGAVVEMIRFKLKERKRVE